MSNVDVCGECLYCKGGIEERNLRCDVEPPSVFLDADGDIISFGPLVEGDRRACRHFRPKEVAEPK